LEVDREGKGQRFRSGLKIVDTISEEEGVHELMLISKKRRSI
jgi:hypothetical protein